MNGVEKEIAAYMPEFNMAAGYLDCVELIKENFQNMAENVVAIGFYLKSVRDRELYKEGNYSSFSEFAREEFGLSPTSTSRYMSINDRFSIDGNSPHLMEDKKGFSKSQLQEMLYLSDEQLETVTPDMTVKQLRELATSQEVEIECQAEDEENFQIPGQLDIEFYPEVLPKGYQGADEKRVQAEAAEGQYATEQEKLEANEDYFIRAFYESLYESEKNVISQRQNAEITKLFKKEYGQTYNGYGKPGGIGWSCYPDKICFTFSGMGENLQITWGKFTTKLLRLLDEHPEIESGTSKDEPEAAGEEPEKGEVIVDADFREIDEEPEQKLSAYGLPKSEYPPESLIAEEGCGHKHICFCCAMDCQIRGKDRYCTKAPMGNPFPCTTMNVLETLRTEVGDTCQFVNHDLAFHRWGDHAPVPCCRKCETPCEHQCRRAAGLRNDNKDGATPSNGTDPVEQSVDDKKEYYNSIEFIRKVLNKEQQNLRLLKNNEKTYGQEMIEETKVIIAALANMICELERMELKEKLAELEKEEK